MKCPDSMFQAYVTCALWSSTDDKGNPLDAHYDVGDIADETLRQMRADCDAFYAAMHEHIHCDDAPLARDFEGSIARDFEGSIAAREAAMAGHDFWLTRCGHGAGFWDGDWPEPYASTLTEACKSFGNVDLYIDDDDKIHA